MNIQYHAGLVAAICAMSIQMSGYAQDIPSVEVGGEDKAAAKIAADFSDFAGDNTESLVKALRTGGSLNYDTEIQRTVLDEQGNPVMIEVVNEDGTVKQVEKTETVIETIKVNNTAGAVGLGNVKLALNLAQATLPEGSSYEAIVKAIFNAEASGILDMRASGMGWGKIYDAYGFKVGELTGKRASQYKEKPEKMSKNGKPELPEKVQKADRPEKPEKPGKPEKPNGNGKK